MNGFALLIFGLFFFLFAVNECKSRGISNEISRTAESNKLSPVIFIPGDGGSQVEARLNKTTTVHYYCDKTTSGFFNIWLNPKLLVPLIIDCWIDNVKLTYDNKTRTTSDNDGVSVRIPGFGRSEVVEWLDPSLTKSLAGAYFKDIANALVQHGYERNITLRGAPYDFRKGPNENKQWFLDMKALVEDTYQRADQQPITLLVHSMGGPMSLLFLQQQPQSWKDKYISKIISLAGAWAGSAKAVKVFAIGDDLGSFALSGSVMRAEQITSPSLAWLLPSPHFWKTNEVLVSTPSKQYSMANLEEFFRDINYTTGWEMRKDQMPYTDFTAPGVEVHCLYGEGSQTIERMNYKTDLTGTPTFVTGDGDGTVNARSLRSCEKWANTKAQNNKKIHSIEIPRADHMGILSDKRVVEYVLNILIGNNATFDPEIIPGVGGNRLSAKLNKTSAVSYLCSKTSDYYYLWLDPVQMVPYLIDCWVDNMKLTYEKTTRTTSNSPGVTINVPGWSVTDTMEWIDTTYIIDNYDFGAYFTHIVDALVQRGYTRKNNIFGAPYDFRRGPNENQEWLKKLSPLIEYAYQMNDNTPVTFIAHSMGGLMLLQYLQSKQPTWKDKYVKQVITLNTPWGGSAQSILAASVGYNFGSSLISNLKMREVQRSCPSVMWLMPSDIFWKPNEVLVQTNNKNYTVSNYEDLFKDMGYESAWEMMKDLKEYHNFTAPRVDVSCVYGTNIDTMDSLNFGSGFENVNPTMKKGKGDGTVNERSLTGCMKWNEMKSMGDHKVRNLELAGSEHYDILSDHRAINHILNKLSLESNFERVHPSKRTWFKFRIF